MKKRFKKRPELRNILFVFGLCCLFMISSLKLHGQENSIIANYFSLDHTYIPYIDSLLNRITLFRKQQLPEKGTAINEKALQLSLQHNYREGTIKAYQNFAYLNQGKDNEAAIRYLNKAIQLTAGSDDKMRLAQQYAFLATLLEQNGDYEEIVILYKRVLPFFRGSGKKIKKLMPAMHNSAGRSYYQRGIYDSALFYYESSLSLLVQPDSTNYRDAIKANAALGMINARIGVHARGLQYFKRAYDIAGDFTDTNAQISQLSNIGVYYYETKDYTLAKKFLLQALQMNKQRANVSSPQIYGMLATIVYHQSPDSLPQAIALAEESYRYAQKSGYTDNIIQSSYILGMVYQKAGQLDRAKQYLLSGLDMALKKKSIENVSTVYSSLYEVHLGLKDYKTALEYQSKYYAIKDSLQGIDNVERITHVEQQYKTAEKDKQLVAQKAAMQIQESRIREKNFWIIAISISLLLLAMLFVVVYRNIQIKQKASMQEVKQQQEIDLLKTRMEAEQQERSRIGRELHDGIVSQLLAIKLNINAIGENDSRQLNEYALAQATQQLEEATIDLRSTAHSLMPDALLQQGLVTATAVLCDKIARTTGVEVDFQEYGNMPCFSNVASLSIYRIIQELIQNTLKHARATFLLIQFSYLDEVLCITVEDNGIGFSGDHFYASTGIGLKTVRQRVNELHGHLHITGKKGMETTVYMEFEHKFLI